MSWKEKDKKFHFFQLFSNFYPTFSQPFPNLFPTFSPTFFQLFLNFFNKEVPPVDSSDPAVNISVSIDLLKLVDIDEEDYSIKIQFEIASVWKEKRAIFKNLKERGSLNTRGHWHPLAAKSHLWEHRSEGDNKTWLQLGMGDKGCCEKRAGKWNNEWSRVSRWDRDLQWLWK